MVSKKKLIMSIPDIDAGHNNNCMCVSQEGLTCSPQQEGRQTPDKYSWGKVKVYPGLHMMLSISYFLIFQNPIKLFLVDIIFTFTHLGHN